MRILRTESTAAPWRAGKGLATLLCAGVWLWAGLAQAEQAPKPGPADARIRKITYHESQVITLEVSYGFHTMVYFAPDETIETVLIGDSESWEAKPVGDGHSLLLKPKDENANTNLTVLTDRRTYSFFLRGKPPRDPAKMMFSVRFVYPEEDAARLAAAEKRAQEVQPASYANPQAPAVDPSQVNFRYSFAGDRSMVPTVLFDDGSFTYLRFEDLHDLPAIFIVDEEKKEALANYRVEGTYVVVHRVARQFTLRSGMKRTCLFNEALDRGAPGAPLHGPQERGAPGDGKTVDWRALKPSGRRLREEMREEQRRRDR